MRARRESLQHELGMALRIGADRDRIGLQLTQSLVEILEFRDVRKLRRDIRPFRDAARAEAGEFEPRDASIGARMAQAHGAEADDEDADFFVHESTPEALFL